MNPETKSAITEALDSSIAKVAEVEFARLCKGLTSTEIADRTNAALNTLMELSNDVKPIYDEWVALFYAVWFQPSHINLAYTLARLLPKEDNPFVESEGTLRVTDFGCGAFALQFGLMLAEIETIALEGRRVSFTVVPKDESVAMKNIGRAILKEFRLSFFEEFKASITPDNCRANKCFPKSRWVVALHVAYSENAESVRSELDEITATEAPGWYWLHRMLTVVPRRTIRQHLTTRKGLVSQYEKVSFMKTTIGYSRRLLHSGGA